MSVLKFFIHLFIPHESNNQKAKAIHSESLAFLTICLIGFQVFINALPHTLPSVLGYAANISVSDVVNLTNKERMANGLTPLSENKNLDNAALAKGNDMLTKGYWAHFAPDGTTPWSFFTQFGYKYRYAGENLARDFSDAKTAVDAWMNSPTHRENILNPRYKEIGIAVVEGSLSGSDTTIIVQFLGASLSSAPSIPVAKAVSAEAVTSTLTPSSSPSVTPAKTITMVISPIPSPTPSPTPTPASVNVKLKISPFGTTKNISLGLLGILLLVFSLDLIIVRRNRIARLGGKTLAHIAYLSMIVAVVLLLKAGQII